jgi:oligosaccharyltransferase complex subunit gamma
MVISNKMIIMLSLLAVSLCHPKGDDLRKRTLNSDNGVIVLNASTFKDLVMKHPRPYDMVILFTLRTKCATCEAVKGAFGNVAESYLEAEGYKPDISNRKRAVFFGILYYSEDATQIFKSLKLPSTTSILYTTPNNILLDDNNEAYIKYDDDFVMSYKDRVDGVYPHKILEFTNAKSGRKVEMKKDPLVFVLYFVIFLIILAGGYKLFVSFQPVFLSPTLWLIGSFAVYIICIGGIVYNIIHGTPFAKFNREGHIVEFIHSGQRSQYVGEGLLLSSLFVLGGTVMMAFNWINRIKGYWAHRLTALGLVLFIAILSRIIIAIYQKKASWYSPTFFPPSGYIRGPLLNDQGNSF